MSQVHYNRGFVEDWQFFLRCSGGDIYSVYSVMQQSNIAIKDGSYKPEDILKSLFSLRYGSEKKVNYTKFITDLCDDLGIKYTKGTAGIFKENELLLYVISKSVKSFSGKQLEEFKIRAGLTNDSKDAIIREVAAKTRSSIGFRKMLPALASVALGVEVGTSSLAALGLGAAAISMVAASPATSIFFAASAALFLLNRKKKSAEQVLPATAIIIRIRREYLIDFRSADEAIAFLRTTIRTCKYNDKEKVALSLLLTFVEKDTEYATPEVLDIIRPNTGIDVNDIITEQKVDAIVPYIKEVEIFLCTYIQENGDSLKVLPILFPKDSKQCTQPVQNSSEVKETDSLVNVKDINEDGIRIAELEHRVARIERILHGIRHNLAPDFANALNPYREFLEDPSIPITIEEARNAESIGSRIFSLLDKAGKEDYGTSDQIDIVRILKAEFSNEPYSVEYKDMPNEAYGVFNKLSFETQVLNNIRKNFSQHAFGAFSEDIFPTASRRVQISIKESDGFWTIIIRNNGDPFPKNADIREVWDYGRSFGKRTCADGGTGMFYIKDCVEHFGGKVDFVPLYQGDFTVEYRIDIKKPKKTISNGL